MLFKLLFSAIIVFAGIVSGSLLYRLQKSKPIMRTSFPQPRFSELWCSGRSNRRTLARWVVAKTILWVTVTENEVHVSPHFPFSLMFLPEAFGWDHRVPAKNIIEVRDASSSLLGHHVVLSYRHATGDEEDLELWVDDIPTLMKALADLREDAVQRGLLPRGKPS